MDAEVRAVDADLVGADADLHCLLQRFSRAVGAAGGVMTETQESECLHAHTNLAESSIIPAGFRVPGPRPGSTLAGPTHILTDGPQTHRFVVPRRQRRPRPSEDGVLVCSPGWARTSDPSINSRMLCQLSYGGTSQSTADVMTSLADSPAAEQSDPECFSSQSCGYPHQPATDCRTV